MIDLILIREGYMYCEDIVIATIAKYYRRDYEMIYLDSWSFIYDKSENRPNLGFKFNTLNVNKVSLLEKYYGIRQNYFNIGNLYEMKKIIFDELSKNNPTVVDLDVFCFEWCNKEERESHSQIPFIIVGYQDGNLQLLDVHTTGKVHLVKEDVFFQSVCKYIYTYEIVKDQEKIDVNLCINYIVDKAIVKHNDFNMFDAIREFASYFENNFNFEYEYINNIDNNFFNTPFINRMKKVISSRGLFSKVFDLLYKYQKVDELINISNNFRILASKWNMILSLITKAYYTGSIEQQRSKIALKIREISDFEEKTYHAIRNQWSKRDDIMTNINVLDEEDNKLIYVDIKQYLNNKGIYNESCMNKKPNLTGLGDFLFFKSDEFNKVWTIGEMKFIFPDKSSKNDNITCDGQEIEIPNNRYDSIMFLGLAEYGDFSEEVTIYHKDNYIEKIVVTLQI
jgi:hypothetical protein